MCLLCVRVRASSPQLLGDEDDASLQDGGGEHQQHLLVAQAVEERGEADVLQPGVQRPRQPDNLVEDTHTHTHRYSD